MGKLPRFDASIQPLKGRRSVIKQSQPTEPVELYFIHADHLNTPRVIVDQTNTVVWQWHNQSAFGDNLHDEDPDNFRMSFEYNLRLAGQKRLAFF